MRLIHGFAQEKGLEFHSSFPSLFSPSFLRNLIDNDSLLFLYIYIYIFCYLVSLNLHNSNYVT